MYAENQTTPDNATKHLSEQSRASFLDLLKQAKPIGLVWLAFGSPAIAEVSTDRSNLPIVVDHQHGLWGRDQLEAVVGNSGAKVPIVVRCAENSQLAIAAALEAGASSVLIPLIDTAEQAARAVAYSNFPPKGVRSVGGLRPLLDILGGRPATDAPAVGIMIESVAGVEAVDEIAATSGLDYIFIGTGDLSLSRGTQDAEILAQDHRRILAAARKHGLPCGLFTHDAKSAAKAIADGFQIAVVSNDFAIVYQGFSASASEFASATEGPAA